MRDLRIKDPKSCSELRSTNFQPSKSGNKACKEAKKVKHNKGRDCACDWDQKAQKSSNPIIEDNASKFKESNQKNKKNKGQTCPDRTAYDLTQVKCYKYQNLGYFISNCPKLLKTSCNFDNLHVNN